MNITSVGYARLKTLEGYNHERVSATADVEAGEAPEDAFISLKNWVMNEIENQVRVHDAREDLQNLTYQRHRAQGELERLLEKIVFLKGLLAKHGIEAEDLDEIPF